MKNEKNNDFDLVEFLISSMEEDNAFDQPCKYGYRVNGHAVYCHNKKWKDAPRKCRRSWYTGNYDNTNEDSDYACKGFEKNENYNE